jgi:hypothetical protein
MASKTAPNSPCPCGSGKKYKRCCRPADLARLADTRTPEEKAWETLLQTSLQELTEPACQWMRSVGLREQEPESWFTLIVEALRQQQPLLARHLLLLVESWPLSPEHHWQATLLWWELQEPQHSLAHLNRTSAKAVGSDNYWSMNLKLQVALEQWSPALESFVHLNPATLDHESWWTLLLAAAQSGQQQRFCTLCEQAARETGLTLWWIIEANALAAWDQLTRARDLYQQHLEAALREPAHGFPPLEQALLQAIRAQAQLSPEQLSEWNRLLCHRKLSDEQLLKQRIEYCVQLDLWEQIAEDAQQWLLLRSDSLEARFFLSFSALMQQTLTPEDWQFLQHIVRTELFPISLWNWFLLRLLLHRFHREAWALLQGLEERDREQTLMLRMIILSQEGMFAQLVAELRPLVDELEPQSFLRLLWGQGLLRTGQAQQSMEVLQPFWEESTGEHRVSYALWLAEAALLDEQPEQARQFLHSVESVPRESRPPVFWYLSGLLKSQQGEVQEAAEEYLELVHRLPEPWVVEVTIRALFLAGRAQEARRLLEDWQGRLPMHDELWYALMLARWMTEEIPGAIKAAEEIQQSWLESSGQHERVLEILASCYAHLHQWLDVLDVCERLQQHLESIENTTLLDEVHRWRREGARGLLQQRSETGDTNTDTTPSLWEQQLRKRIREEVLEQQLEAQAAFQMKQELLEAERHQFTTLLDLLSGPSESGQKPLSERLRQLREEYTALSSQLSAEEEDKRIETQEHYLASLQSIVAEYQGGQLGDAAYREVWGDGVWKRLPHNTRQLLQSAEVLFSLLDSQPQQDHAPILMQWTRAAEELLNLRLADNLASFAHKQGLPLDELPALGGRILQRQGNQLSLGAFPYLLAERWKKDEGDTQKSVFNHQWTPALQQLWTQWQAALSAARVPEAQQSYLRDKLPTECQRWALIRNRVSHAGGVMRRDDVLALRRDWLLQPPNLFTMVTTLPVL